MADDNQGGLTTVEQNKLMRELLIRNSPKILKKLPSVTGALGNTLRVKLNNTGLITRLFVDIRIPYVTTVAPTGVSPKGIFAAVPKVQLVDFDGSTRINTSSYHLAVINAMRGRGVFGSAGFLSSQAAFSALAFGSAAAFRAPNGVAAIQPAGELRMVLEVPLAADVKNGDLRGMLASQFVSGEIQLALDFATSLTGTANDDFVFNGGTFTSQGAPIVTVYQEYYLPQKIRNVTAIPQLDISTVYEIGAYSRTTDNIAVGQEKLIPFPNVREVNGVAINFMNNLLLGGGSTAVNGVATNDLQSFTVYMNGNNIGYQADQYTQNWLERQSLKTDLPQGTYMLDFSQGPISTAIFGAVQLAIVPGGTLTTPAVETTFESLYPKGAALSGTPT